MAHANPKNTVRRARVARLVAPLVCAAAYAAPVEAQARDGASSEVQITPFAGAGVQIEYRGRVIHVDPWSRGDYSSAKPADLILVTDTPNDHLDPALIATLRKPGAPVIVSDSPEAARDEGSRDRLLQVADRTVMNNGDRMTFAGIPVEAVAMYDIIPGDPFHAKGEGNGYILTLGETRVYLAGVTECVPEMRDIHDIDIAFIPMNLPHGRMEPRVAADCVKMLRPRVVYPYHYRELPIDDFVESLRGERDIEVRVYDWYPPAR
jgi:L-ascorbate metabolism protein UlaG (beta-lactamase superfamily)